MARRQGSLWDFPVTLIRAPDAPATCAGGKDETEASVRERNRVVGLSEKREEKTKPVVVRHVTHRALAGIGGEPWDSAIWAGCPSLWLHSTASTYCTVGTWDCGSPALSASGLLEGKFRDKVVTNTGPGRHFFLPGHLLSSPLSFRF